MSGGREGHNAAAGDYPVELQRRLQALRRDHPEIDIEVDLAHASDNLVVVKATIRLPIGGAVSSLGTVAGEVGPAAIEQAEQRAIERALAIAFPPPAVSEALRPAEPTPIAARQAQSSERRGPAPIRTNAPIDIGVSRPTPPAASKPSGESGDAVLADYSWTAFWLWAKENGLSKQTDIEAIIGQSYEDLTPAQVRKLIVEKRGG